MNHHAVHRLLLDVGFRNGHWPPSRGQWSVVGEIEGGARIDITCLPSVEGTRLQVAPAAAREWLCELLERHGARGVLVTTDAVGDAASRTPWLAISVGAGAVALFGWVLGSIVR